MDLIAYCETTGETIAAFGRRAGIPDKGKIWRYAHGKRWPSAETLMLIEQATGGAVTASDMARVHAEAKATSGHSEAVA